MIASQGSRAQAAVFMALMRSSSSRTGAPRREATDGRGGAPSASGRLRAWARLLAPSCTGTDGPEVSVSIDDTDDDTDEEDESDDTDDDDEDESDDSSEIGRASCRERV